MFTKDVTIVGEHSSIEVVADLGGMKSLTIRCNGVTAVFDQADIEQVPSPAMAIVEQGALAWAAAQAKPPVA
jgi:hypothetical protein